MMSRRQALALGAGSLAGYAAEHSVRLPRICIFSKHLQWLNVADAAALAREIGFDGMDLTVREGGHVEPARVAVELPRAVEAVRKAGLEVPMITAGIVDAASAHAAEILRTASALDIRRYRWGGLTLDWRRAIPAQLDACRSAVRDLAALNKQYGACAMYHTHSGAGVLGASIWDLYLVLKDFDPNAVAVNFDVAHATVEGGLGGWQNSASLVAPYLRGIALKDFYWTKTRQGSWEPRWCPIGEGMVNFAQYFEFLRASHFSGPVQLHFEYPEMGGADLGKRAIAISREQFAGLAARDLNKVKVLMRRAGWTQA